MVQGAWISAHGTRSRVYGTRCKVQGTRFRVYGTGFRVDPRAASLRLFASRDQMWRFAETCGEDRPHRVTCFRVEG